MDFDTFYNSLSDEDKATFSELGQQQEAVAEVVPFEDFMAELSPKEKLMFLEGGALERASTFQEPKSFDPMAPAVGGILGAGLALTPLGAGANLFGRAAGPVARAVIGGVEGTAAGTAGEAVRTGAQDLPWYYREPLAMGSELATGMARPLASELTRLGTAALAVVSGGWQKGKVGEAILGRSESDLAVRAKLFGEGLIEKGVASTTSRESLDNKLVTDVINRFGIIPEESIPIGKKASDAVRNTIYSTLEQQKLQNVFMKNSPEIKNAISQLNSLARDKIIDKQQVRAVEGLFNRQVTDPRLLKDPFEKTLINTLQKAKPEFNGVPLSEDTINIVRKATDDYLSKIGENSGRAFPSYSNLKFYEQQEMVAKAIDSIPVVIGDGFSDKHIKQALVNINGSPEGQKALLLGVSSYFKSLPPSQVLTEWNRIKGSLKGIPSVSIKSLDRSVSEFLKRDPEMIGARGQVAKDILGNAAKSALIKGLVPAEVGRGASELLSPKKITENPIYAL